MKKEKSENLIVHDIRGQICPSCLLFTLRELNDQKKACRECGTRIIIKTDNRDATTTIPDAVSSMGYDCSVEKKDGYYELLIMYQRKRGPADRRAKPDGT